jgi:PIN domain nuclease of toxin-antitoxin system
MRILLDTHTLLWVLMAPERLPAALHDRIEAPENTLLVSVLSAWEIAIKQGLGKLDPPGDLEEAVVASGFTFLGLTPEHCRAYAALPRIPDHRDPFDRMLAVQARLEGCRLASRDARLDAYGIERLWE